MYGGNVGRHSVVGTATCYRLDGPGIKSQWGRDFFTVQTSHSQE